MRIFQFLFLSQFLCIVFEVSSKPSRQDFSQSLFVVSVDELLDDEAYEEDFEEFDLLDADLDELDSERNWIQVVDKKNTRKNPSSFFQRLRGIYKDHEGRSYREVDDNFGNVHREYLDGGPDKTFVRKYSRGYTRNFSIHEHIEKTRAQRNSSENSSQKVLIRSGSKIKIVDEGGRVLDSNARVLTGSYVKRGEEFEILYNNRRLRVVAD